jgi:acyl dehydratase
MTHRTTFKQLSDVKDAIGKEIGLSDWMTITQEQVNTFAKVTQDEQWIHVDIEKSKKHSPYGTTIAHGFFVLSLASKFAEELVSFEGVKMMVNYGMDKVRFPNATPVGAELRARLSVMDYEKNQTGHVIN